MTAVQTQLHQAISQLYTLLNLADISHLLFEMKNPAAFLWTLLLLSSVVSAGPLGYGICQAGCSAIVMACYSAAGFTWGATLGATAPATILACNSSFGFCQAACASALLVPIPWSSGHLDGEMKKERTQTCLVSRANILSCSFGQPQVVRQYLSMKSHVSTTPLLSVFL